jgi:hypothetical protein
MRSLFALASVLVFAGQFYAAAEDGQKVKLEGTHLCCKACEAAVRDILKNAKVDNVNVDRGAKTISFEADKDVAEKAIKALYEGGFAGKATIGDKEFKIDAKAPDLKADEITVKNCHICCGQCVNAIKGLFKDAKVTVTGKGAIRDMTVSGKDLTAEQVLRTLNEAGFNGVIEKK